MVQLTQTQAFEILTDLLGYKGKLRMVTSEPNKESITTDETVPSYWVQHNIVKLEVIPAQANRDRMEVRARTEEGDTMRGNPTSLLNILTKWDWKEPTKVD